MGLKFGGGLTNYLTGDVWKCVCGNIATKVEIALNQVEYKRESREISSRSGLSTVLTGQMRMSGQVDLFPVCENCCSKGDAKQFILVASLTEETKQTITKAIALPGPEQRSIRLQDDE